MGINEIESLRTNDDWGYGMNVTRQSFSFAPHVDGWPHFDFLHGSIIGYKAETWSPGQSLFSLIRGTFFFAFFWAPGNIPCTWSEMEIYSVRQHGVQSKSRRTCQFQIKSYGIAGLFISWTGCLDRWTGACRCNGRDAFGYAVCFQKSWSVHRFGTSVDSYGPDWSMSDRVHLGHDCVYDIGPRVSWYFVRNRSRIPFKKHCVKPRRNHSNIIIFSFFIGVTFCYIIGDMLGYKIRDILGDIFLAAQSV